MKYKILLVLFAIIIVCSAILSFVPLEKSCKSTLDSCKIVHASEYDSLLGIKNSYLGLGAFIIMFGLTLSHIKRPRIIKRWLITAGLTIGTAFAVYFLYIQFIILKATCMYCLITDVTTIIGFLVLLTMRKRY